jgi:hypothetical protein
MHLQRNKSERELFFFRTHRKGPFESMSGATVTDQGVPQEREGKLRVCHYSVSCAMLKLVILQNLGVGRGKLFERYAPTWQTVAKRSMAHKLTKLILIYLGLTVLALLALSQWTTGSEEIQEISISMQTEVYIRLLPTRDQQ